MSNNANRQTKESVPAIHLPAIIKKIEDSPGWEAIREREKKKQSSFSSGSWSMPEQPEGYIKARRNDFL